MKWFLETLLLKFCSKLQNTDTSTSLKMEEEIVELVDFCFC